MYVYFNYELSECEVASVCGYLANAYPNVTLGANKSGCDSRNEVEQACLTVHEHEIISSPDFLIYPIPSKEIIILSFSMKSSAIVHINITNIQGKVVKEIPKSYYQKGPFNKQIKIDALNSGMYIINVNTGKLTYNRKIVVL